MHRLALGRPARLKPLDRPHDALPHRASVDLANGQKMVGTGRRLVCGVATEALRQQQRRAPAVVFINRCRAPLDRAAK